MIATEPARPAPPASPKRGALLAAAGALLLLAACAAPERSVSEHQPPPGQSLLEGWQHCTTANCGRDFASAYTVLVFLRVDGTPLPEAPALRLAPGRHWIEAHYAWGAGLLVGLGNYRNYAFEFDFVADHSYAIEEVPGGCIVPLNSRWVSPKVIRLHERSADGEQRVHAVRALESCAPGGSQSATCRTASDCPSGPCTPFGGSTGFGLCGKPR